VTVSFAGYRRGAAIAGAVASPAMAFKLGMAVGGEAASNWQKAQGDVAHALASLTVLPSARIASVSPSTFTPTGLPSSSWRHSPCSPPP
jgi:hypothetical protein